MTAPFRLGDYLVFPAFAQGGTASVHLARLMRAGGFRRLVVVKRLKGHIADDPQAPERLLREARLSSRVRSPYVVSTLDVIHRNRELALVMEFVHGITLGRLLELAHARGAELPPRVAVAIACNVLRGLHAAHEATTEDGTPLELMHRDVAPNNVLVGSDGMARVVDFEIAQALGFHGTTASGEVRGTLAYMAPEQLRGGRLITRQTDLYATGVLLWESLTGRRLREGDISEVIAAVGKPPDPPSKVRPDVPSVLDAIVLRALRVESSERHPSAEAMAAELEEALPPAPPQEVARTLEKLAFDDLERLRELVAECERYEPEEEAPSTSREGGSIVGSLIAGKYRVESILGRGGMGVVVQARHVTLNEPVAIKLVSTEADPEDTSSTERIVREARASLRIKSEHVVRVFDVGIEKRRPYLVMEKLDGTDLRSLLREGQKLPVDVVVLYVLQACEVLAEAHSLGIIHRDLKPANLFLTHKTDGSPHVKVLDFGIAKAIEADLTMTDTRAMLGSPAYMSPEQLRSAKHVDERTDVWGMGVVLYEMLTGQHPFAGDDGNVQLAGIIADEPRSLRTRRSDIPEGLDRLVLRALAKDPTKRVQSIAELAVALARYAPKGERSVARIRLLAGERDVGDSSAGESSRKRLVASILAVVAVAAAASFAFRRVEHRDAHADDRRPLADTPAPGVPPPASPAAPLPAAASAADPVEPTPPVASAGGTAASAPTPSAIGSAAPRASVVGPRRTNRTKPPVAAVVDAGATPRTTTAAPAAPAVSDKPPAPAASAPAKTPPKRVDPTAEFE